ncbi:hypothetical protein HPK21_01308 [Helicobacter pylori]|nr:hypothetical protein HPK21_01308 [Helicobacter pylori]
MRSFKTICESGEKERNNEVYQESLNDEELQNDLRKWRNGEKPGFFESLFNDLFGKFKSLFNDLFGKFKSLFNDLFGK